EQIARPPVDLDIGSGVRYREPPLERDGVTLVISQAGETIRWRRCVTPAAGSRRSPPPSRRRSVCVWQLLFPLFEKSYRGGLLCRSYPVAICRRPGHLGHTAPIGGRRRCPKGHRLKKGSRSSNFGWPDWLESVPSAKEQMQAMEIGCEQ